MNYVSSSAELSMKKFFNHMVNFKKIFENMIEQSHCMYHIRYIKHTYTNKSTLSSFLNLLFGTQRPGKYQNY